MEELLGTWRTGGQDGGELFRDPDEGRTGRVQRGIESALFGTGQQPGQHDGGADQVSLASRRGRKLEWRIADTRSVQPEQVQSPPPGPPPNDRSDVLVDVRRLLQIREAQAIANPEDAVNAGQISALRNLETVSTRLAWPWRSATQKNKRLTMSHLSNRS